MRTLGHPSESEVLMLIFDPAAIAALCSLPQFQLSSGLSGASHEWTCNGFAPVT